MHEQIGYKNKLFILIIQLFVTLIKKLHSMNKSLFKSNVVS